MVHYAAIYFLSAYAKYFYTVFAGRQIAQLNIQAAAFYRVGINYQFRPLLAGIDPNNICVNCFAGSLCCLDAVEIIAVERNAVSKGVRSVAAAISFCS